MKFGHSARRWLSRPYSLPLSVSVASFIKMFLSVKLRQVKISLGLYDPLTRLASKYRSDKGVTVFPFHAYTIFYADLFEQFRKREIAILEIGLARRDDRDLVGIGCPSLQMWLEYFPYARVYGLDIDDFSSVQLPRTKIFCGDQGRVNDLLKITKACSKFDIIIDDGSHASFHQQLSLKVLFPFLGSKGVYAIEDLNFQPEDLEITLPSAIKTKELLRNRQALNELISGAEEVLLLDSKIQYSQETLGVIMKE